MSERAPIYRCPECLAVAGQLHEIFCLKERCPFCGGQLASCPCIFEVLALTPEEQKTVEDYVDDSVEPLRSINERWEAALARKGRIAVTGHVE
jgi:rRNA maturation protein Nop10